MCGIVGYIGDKDAIPLIIEGLEKLEYRGYDSAGVATISNGQFEVFRREGKLANLKKLLKEKNRLGQESNVKHSSIGIGHTRWATHGRPNETNAHPHIVGDICVIHNGIIENFSELRIELQKEGRTFRSDTDTEIAAHIIEREHKNGSSLLQAVRDSLKKFRGNYALVVLSATEPDKIVVAKNATPVIIGLGENENFVASDIPAILEHTRRVIALEDGDIAVVTKDKVQIEHQGEAVERAPINITWDPVTAEKGGFRHFMQKEIYEQPQAISQTFRPRIDSDRSSVFLEDITIPENIDRICLVACGTAWHAALVIKFYLERFARLPVDVDYASEFRYREPTINNKTLFIVVSQSGETADTLGALTLANENGAYSLAICNVVGSSITRKAKQVLYTHAGPEISVASTKAFVTQLTAGFLLALSLGERRGHLTPVQIEEHFNSLRHLPAVISAGIAQDKAIEKIARKYGKSPNFLYLGRGILYPVALEGALKMKEISYLHAEGYPAGEMKHGPIALINEDTPVVVAIGQDGINYEKSISNLKEVEARGGQIIAITDKVTPELAELAWETIAVGEISPLLLPHVLTVPLQMLAYHVAVYRGTDVDQPRNLAKSVTVE
jgi:glucosamine--fructose-6-phosphate aminotransferase (isomerizing)